MGGIKRDPHQNAVGVWHLENLSRWREILLYIHAYADGRPGRRGLFSPLLLPPSGWRELIPSVRTRNRHMLHTQQKEQALEWQCLQKDHFSPLSLLVEAQIQSPCGEAALMTHQHSSFPDPTGVWLSSKCIGLLPNPSPAFPHPSASRRANWVPCCSASTSLLSALCLSP